MAKPSLLSPMRPFVLFALLALTSYEPAASTPLPQQAAQTATSTATASVSSTDTASAAASAALQQGIDVSAYSGDVSWTTLVTAGHSFAFAKATEGETLKDPDFDDNWQQMKAAGILRGAYHFYVVDDDPTVQAQFFLSTVTFEPGDLAPVVDVETLGDGTADGLAAKVQTFLNVVEQATGIKPIIYTTADFWNENVGEGFGAYPLWVAEYDVDSPKVPDGWQTWHLWQWQEDATVTGVPNGADLSKVNSSGADLASLRVPGRTGS